jgi:hypothetical protein
MFVNVQGANLQDLIKVYYYGTDAHTAADNLLALIGRNDNLRLSVLLRDHRTRPVYSVREIELRAATDELLNCGGILEIASLTGFISDIQKSTIGERLRIIYGNKHVRRYYESYYPTKLPQLFLARLRGHHSTHEREEEADTIRLVLSFLELDRTFTIHLNNCELLRMLDSFQIDSVRFSDIVQIIEDPQTFSDYLLRSPDDQDVTSRAINQLSMLMQFCFDLNRLLADASKHPLLRSAMWSHYGYWFEIIGDEIRDRLGFALNQFLKWKPLGNKKEAFSEVHSYVSRARLVLSDLTSRQFAMPVENLLLEIEKLNFSSQRFKESRDTGGKTQRRKSEKSGEEEEGEGS